MLFWGERGSISEGRQWVEQALRAGATGGPVPAVVSANAHECAGWLALLQNDVEQATRQYHQALPLYQKAGIPGGRPWSLLWLGWCALRTGKREEASRLLEQSRGVFDQEEAKGPTPPFHLSVIPLFLAVIATDSQDYPEAQSLLDRSLALAYQENSQEHVAWVRRYQGRLALAQGEQELACVRFEESLALSRTQINRVGIAHSLYGLGLGALLRGDLLGARKLLSESLVVFQQPGMQPANTALVRSPGQHRDPAGRGGQR